MDPINQGEAVKNLQNLLSLKDNGNDRFTGPITVEEWARVFGGQVIAQSLLAACHTIDGRLPHSLHAYFIRPGEPKKEIDFEVSRDRDGHSFSVRRVAASQEGKIILNMACSYQVEEEGLHHQFKMPDVAPPDNLKSEIELYAQLFESRHKITENVPESFKNHLLRPRSIEFRPLVQDRYVNTVKSEPLQGFWFRLASPINVSQTLQRAILAYSTDMMFLSTCLLPHGILFTNKSLQVASLDHALWFHEDVNLNEWHLYYQDSPWSGHGRGMNRGLIFNQNGNLIAEVAQEALIRMRKGQDKNPALSKQAIVE